MEGTVNQIHGGRVVRFERYLNHRVEKVWAFITRSEKIVDWLTAHAEMDLVEGGSIKLRWENGDIVKGTFKQVNPPYELEYTWNEPSAGKSLLRWELQPEGAGCSLILTHTFFDSEQLPNFLAGWHVHLDVLAIVLQDRTVEFPWDRVKDLRKIYAAKLG
jgi:uncharacterized protein YndB with AHSA1/START domain